MSQIRDRIRELERASRSLEPGPPERSAHLDAVSALGERFLTDLARAPAFDVAAGTGLGLLDLPIRGHGVPIDTALRVFEDEVVRPGANPASGGHLAFIPGGGLYHSALADYLAAITNKYAGIFFTGPGAVRMERLLVRWTADLLGFPETAAGTIVSGGSLANLTAMVCAREARGLRSADIPAACAYMSDQVHHSITKALRIAGLGEAKIRQVATDARGRICPDALGEAIAADRAHGLRPWLVVGTAGSTDRGAVDPLDALAALAAREGCWFHVDAAYGGYFLLTTHGQEMMTGIDRADSVILDPHKSLFLPWGSGIVIVRDGAALAAAHQATGHYLQDSHAAVDEVSPADLSPELTRHFRAVRMWLPLVLLGTTPFRVALEEKLLLARYFHSEVEKVGFEVGPPPDLSIATFRLRPRWASRVHANRINQGIVDSLREDGRIFLSTTLLDGLVTLRLAVLCFRTHLRDVDLALRLLAEHASAAAHRFYQVAP